MKKGKIILFILIILALLAGVYLNRAYARIFSKFDQQPWPINVAMETEKKPNTIKYVALGDSLTFGIGADRSDQSFPALLAKKLTTETTAVELTNLGIPGAIVHNVIYDEFNAAITAKPDLITLLIGVNDLHNFVDLDVYKNNLRIILTALKKDTTAKIVILSLPNLGTKSLVLPPYDLYYAKKTAEYNEALKAVATEAGVQFIDISTVTDQWNGDKSYYGVDEFHPSAKGYESWVNKIYVQLK